MLNGWWLIVNRVINNGFFSILEILMFLIKNKNNVEKVKGFKNYLEYFLL